MVPIGTISADPRIGQSPQRARQQPLRRLASPPVLIAVALLGAVAVGKELRSDVKLPANVSAIPAMMTDPRIWLGIGGILLLQRLIPARKPPAEAVPVWHDMLWFGLQFAVWDVLLGVMLAGLNALFSNQLAGFQLDGPRYLPRWALFAIGVVIGDLVLYWAHRLHHSVPLLWHIHAVHHSQTELNLFSDVRVHPAEFVVVHSLLFVPFFFLGGHYWQPLGLLGFLFVLSGRVHHANLRTNFGPARWVLVTPQSHRIHHSAEPEHFDQNYGNIFSFWDRLFRTHHPDARSYPATGIADETFPLERQPGAYNMARAYAAQLAYPFRRPSRRAHYAELVLAPAELSNAEA
jgi:sterol desaturase/sphingolipid hydroxylase (fatty acid hydroxylase superfamily)